MPWYGGVEKKTTCPMRVSLQCQRAQREMTYIWACVVTSYPAKLALTAGNSRFNSDSVADFQSLDSRSNLVDLSRACRGQTIVNFRSAGHTTREPAEARLEEGKGPPRAEATSAITRL